MPPVKCDELVGLCSVPYLGSHTMSQRCVVSIQLEQPCPACNGRGLVMTAVARDYENLLAPTTGRVPKPPDDVEVDCMDCRGTGKVAHENLLVLLGAIAEYEPRDSASPPETRKEAAGNSHTCPKVE